MSIGQHYVEGRDEYLHVNLTGEESKGDDGRFIVNKGIRLSIRPEEASDVNINANVSNVLESCKLTE